MSKVQQESTYWKYGEKSKLSSFLSIPLSNLCEVLDRKRGVSRERALQLEEACNRVFLGQKNIPWRAWFFNKSTDHPAFKEKTFQV